MAEKKKLVVPVEVYSRVVGYFRPVNQWNRGKQQEFSERSVYVVPGINEFGVFEDIESQRSA